MTCVQTNKTFKIRLRWILLFNLMWLLGCAMTPRPMEVRSDIDALATTDAQNRRQFMILPGNKDTSEYDLQFIEFKNHVEKALIKRGFIKAASLQAGDVVVYLSYGIGEPQVHQYAYDVPVWTGYGYYPYYGRRYGYYPRMGMMYGVGGYAQRLESYTLYRRYLMLDAYDATAYLNKQTPQQLWKISVQSMGQSNDLRLTLPFMVTAMQPYIASNTGQIVTVDVDEFNPLLQEIRSHYPNTSPVLPGR